MITRQHSVTALLFVLHWSLFDAGEASIVIHAGPDDYYSDLAGNH